MAQEIPVHARVDIGRILDPGEPRLVGVVAQRRARQVEQRAPQAARGETGVARNSREPGNARRRASG